MPKPKQCEYCKKFFSSKSVLTRHQTTTKYCLRKYQETDNKNYMCDFCGKYYSTPNYLEIHKKKCMIKHQEKESIPSTANTSTITSPIPQPMINPVPTLVSEEEIQRLREENAKLQSLVRKNKEKTAAKKMEPRIIDIKLDMFMAEEIIQKHLTIKYVNDGPDGIAEFIVRNLLTDEKGFCVYNCSDVSRKVFTFTQYDGTEIKDIGAVKLMRTIMPMIYQKIRELKKEQTNMYSLDLFNTDTTSADAIIHNIKNKQDRIVRRIASSIVS